MEAIEKEDKEWVRKLEPNKITIVRVVFTALLTQVVFLLKYCMKHEELAEKAVSSLLEWAQASCKYSLNLHAHQSCEVFTSLFVWLLQCCTARNWWSTRHTRL